MTTHSSDVSETSATNSPVGLVDDIFGFYYRVRCGEDRSVEWISDGCKPFSGFAPEELSGTDTWFETIVHPDDLSRVLERVSEARETGSRYEVTYRIRTKENGTKWVIERGQCVESRANEEVIEAVVCDVTDRIDRERTLATLNEATRDLMEADTTAQICEIAVATAQSVLDLPITAVHLFDPDERILEPIEWTPRAEELFEEIPTYNEGEGLTWDVFESGEARLFVELQAEADIYNPDTPIQTEIISPLGKYGALTTGTTIAQELDEYDLDLIKLLAANVEAALDRADRGEELRRQQRIVDAVGDGIYQLDAIGNVVSVNDVIVEKTGYSREELIGEHISTVLCESAIKKCLAVIHHLLEGDAKSVGTTDIEVQTASGNTVACEVRIALLYDDGEFDGTVGVLHDITERKRREREIENQRDELTRLNRINAVIRDINQTLVSAESRTEIEQAVCSRLTESDAYLFAWIGEPDRHREELVPRASAGEIGDYLETITVRTDDSSAGRGPAGKASRTGDVQVVQNIRSDSAFEPWLDVVTDYGYESVASIPIAYEHNRYGVLSVYSSRPNAFDPEEQDVLEELGETIGLAINATERKEALMSKSAIELEFRLPGVLVPLVEATADRECTISFERTISTNEGYVQYPFVEGMKADAFESAIADEANVTHVRLMEETAGGALFEVSLKALPLQEAIVTYGGQVPQTTIENGELTILVEIPTSADTRQVVETITELFTDAELISQQTVTRTPDSVIGHRSAITERLTEKQRSALELAYFAGFFDWPRQTSGEEVADLLEIAPATFSQHLRTAERKVFETLLEEA